MLQNLSFILARTGQSTSSQYAFVNLTAIDILSQYPQLSQEFLEEIRPAYIGQIPAHPLDRCLDLHFLNTAEHFTLVLSPTVNEQLLISAALPYLAAGGNNNLLEIFEAAHSIVLAVLAAPRSADMAANHLPFYVNTLFNVCKEKRYSYELLLFCYFQLLMHEKKNLKRYFPKTFPRASSDSPTKPYFA